jgi:hypothetical protein
MIETVQAQSVIEAYKEKHPVRPERTGVRDLAFSAWMRKCGRPSKAGCFIDRTELGCYVAHDLDFIIQDYKRKMIQLLEVKTRYGEVTYSQEKTLHLLDRVLSTAAPVLGLTYLGCHVLRLDGTDPENSWMIEWDGEEVDQETCWRLVNMIDALS